MWPVFPVRMNALPGTLGAVIVFAILTSFCDACLWDWDTLQMERRRFPGVLELMTGKFVRHSPAYYEWRISDRSQRFRSPAEDPELADDLAVAYSKLGRHAEAIMLLDEVLKTHPDRYETLSNLGTIHMLAGDLRTGKDEIDRAITINPDAHFGREKYQSLLADYFLTARGSIPPTAADVVFLGKSKNELIGFSKFVIEKKSQDLLDQSMTEEEKARNRLLHGQDWAPHRPLTDEEMSTELAAAQKAVLGMMHFANYDSPLLLEVLGDLLVASTRRQDDALQLAARAYYRIVQLSGDDETKEIFKRAARNAVTGHLDYIRFRGDWDKVRTEPFRDELEKLSADLNLELSDAAAYFTNIVTDEQRWISEGRDVDQAFAAKYYDSLESTIEAAQKQLSQEPRDVRGNPYDEAVRRGLLTWAAILAAMISIGAGGVFAYRRCRRSTTS